MLNTRQRQFFKIPSNILLHLRDSVFTYFIHRWMVFNFKHLDEHIIRLEVILKHKELRMIYPYFITNMC